MSFFEKLFGGGKQRFEMTPTAVMMNEDRYWKLISDSLVATAGEQDDQAQYLTNALGELEPVEIIGFRLRTDKLLYDTYNSDMWCAGYIMNGGCSDDGFEYFRLWIISGGREVYENAKASPDSLAGVYGGEVEDLYSFEEFWYVANSAFEKKTGKNLYDYIDNDNFRMKEGDYPEIEFNWKEEDPESMKKLCPNLFDRFEGRTS